MIVGRKLATLHELDSVYGLKDAFLLLEILAVDAHNMHCWREAK